MNTIVIVGSNRGIGLALTQQLTQQGHRVFATCRTPSKALLETGATLIEGIDVTDDEAGTLLARGLEGHHIDWVILNAGVLTNETLDHLDFGGIRRQMEVNAFGPLRMAHGLLPCLGEGSKIGIVTSRMGSVTDNTSGSRYGYRMSKAAVNMAGKSLAVDLEPQGIGVFLLHPGFVRTDMTGGNGMVEPEFAAAGIVARMTELTVNETGTFWHAQGEPLPW